MDGDKIQFMARREQWNFGVSLYMRKKNGKHTTIAKPIVFEEVENNVVHVDPIAVVSIEEAQNLMDELWDCGLRPTEGTGSAGAFAATQKHLEDMRTLVFEEK